MMSSKAGVLLTKYNTPAQEVARAVLERRTKLNFEQNYKNWVAEKKKEWVGKKVTYEYNKVIVYFQ